MLPEIKNVQYQVFVSVCRSRPHETISTSAHTELQKSFGEVNWVK